MATDAGVGLGVADAARLLSLTPNAVRKRIKRGSLPAYKDGDDWRVIVSDEGSQPTPRPTPRDRPRPEPQGTPRPTPPLSVASDIRVSHDPARQAQQLAIVQEMLAPFIAELGETKHRLGVVETELAHERERREVAERALDELRTSAMTSPAALGATQAADEPMMGHTGSSEATGRSRASRRPSWFARLLFGNYDENGLPATGR